MKSLTFKIDRGYAISNLQEITISGEDMKAYKDKINKEYTPFIDKLNASGAFVKLIIANDGKTIISHNLSNVTAEILDEIHDHDLGI